MPQRRTWGIGKYVISRAEARVACDWGGHALGLGRCSPGPICSDFWRTCEMAAVYDMMLHSGAGGAEWWRESERPFRGSEKIVNWRHLSRRHWLVGMGDWKEPISKCHPHVGSSFSCPRYVWRSEYILLSRSKQGVCRGLFLSSVLGPKLIFVTGLVKFITGVARLVCPDLLGSAYQVLQTLILGPVKEKKM